MFYIDQADGLYTKSTPLVNTSGEEVTKLFVSGRVGPTVLFKTESTSHTLNPVWRRGYRNALCQESERITINVRSIINELGGSAEVASVSFSCEQVIKGDKIEGWFDLNNNGEKRGRIKLSVHFNPKDEEKQTKHLQVIIFYEYLRVF